MQKNTRIDGPDDPNEQPGWPCSIPHRIDVWYMLGVKNSHCSSGKWRFMLGFPTQILEDPMYGIFTYIYHNQLNVHSGKLTSHLRIGISNRKYNFQPSIFRCYVSFREGRQIYHTWILWEYNNPGGDWHPGRGKYLRYLSIPIGKLMYDRFTYV